MGYLTYRIFRGVSLDRLAEQVRATLNLYEPDTEGRKVIVTAMDGTGCTALQMGYMRREESHLMGIGYQLGCIWMDVRYCDGDWWELSAYQGAEHRVSHNPNPWADGEKVKWDDVPPAALW